MPVNKFLLTRVTLHDPVGDSMDAAFLAAPQLALSTTPSVFDHIVCRSANPYGADGVMTVYFESSFASKFYLTRKWMGPSAVGGIAHPIEVIFFCGSNLS